MCKVEAAHPGSKLIKISWKLDQMQTVNETDFWMQDLVSEMIRGGEGRIRILPAPPSDKERKVRALLSKRRAQAARRRR